MSFTDSFLDFEAIKNWFENIPNPDMADGERVDTVVFEADSCLERTGIEEHNVGGSELIFDGSKSVAKVEERECKMLDMADGEKVDTMVCEADSSLEKTVVEGSELIVDGSNFVAKVEEIKCKILDMADGEKVDTVVCEADSCLEKIVVEEHNVEGSELIVDGSKPVAEVKERECEMLENVSCLIVEDMGKVSLVGESGDLVSTGENATMKSELTEGNDEKGETVSKEDESESSESETATTSSSSSASSSSCSSSDDDDDDDSDVEEETKDEKKVAKAEKKVNERIDVEEGEIRDTDGQDMPNDNDNGDDDIEAMVGWSDGEEEVGEDGRMNPIRSKNEVKALPHVPLVDAKLLPHHQMMPVGVVLSILGPQVIVEGIEKHNPLSDGSILWITESRSPLGFIDEIFGPVKHPYYIVRYNSEDEVPSGISTGTLVSFVPEFASHVLNNKDIYKKGYDASGANDEELTDEEEFSDDEKEVEYKRMLKTAKRGGTDEQQPRSSKNNKKNAKNRNDAWKNRNHFPQETQNNAGRIPPNQNQPQFSSVPTMVDHGNFSTSFTVGGTSLPLPLPPLAQAACLSAPPNGVWPNSIPFHHPLGAFPPNGFQMNNMTWPSQNPQQYLYQMPMPNGMPFNHQVNPMQGLLSGQPNTLPGIPYAQGHVGQSNFNPTAFGAGFQGQPLQQPGLNVGEQGGTSNGMVMGQNFNVPQSGGIVGNNDAPQQFNSGPSGHGKGSYQRGGGRFRRGRGRKQ